MDTFSWFFSFGCLLLAILNIQPVNSSQFGRSRRMPKLDTFMLAKRDVVGRHYLTFKGKSFQDVTLAERHQDVVLECEVGGSPSPRIHWLKDGERIQQGYTRDYTDDEAVYEDKMNVGSAVLRLGKVNSRLYLDCVTSKDEAVYTCVAETPYERVTQSTVLRLANTASFQSKEKCMAKKATRGESARIFMWTALRLEFEGAAVQLLCRAEGYPKPKVTWRYMDFGEEITNDDKHEILPNGDLLITDITWGSNMGNYFCTAENEGGIDQQSTFLYPTSPDDEE